jgi:cold shock CspA family protein
MWGTMLWFNPAKGFGFITADDGERIYVDLGGFLPEQDPGARCRGRPVRFERRDGNGDVRAVNVSFPAEQDSRRARLRHSRGGRAL